MGFRVRDTAGHPATIDWGAGGAVVATVRAQRTLRYTLALPAAPTRIGLFLLGSMRVERDLQYAGRDTGVFQTPTFVPAELDQLVTNIDRKSTRLNSSHTVISYAVFCLKKKK